VTVVGVTVWWTIGFNAVVYLAGLQDISEELYAAARLDGASRLAQFWHVTLPGLREVLALVTTTTLIGCANVFGQMVLLTGGGPAYATRTAVMYIAGEGLGRFRIGQATAMGFVLALMISALGLLSLRLFREREA
jgi:multiple sugar transport system permease protein